LYNKVRNKIDYMANPNTLQQLPPTPELGIDAQLNDAFGNVIGPTIGMHLRGVIGILDYIDQPELNAATKAHLYEQGTDVTRVVVDAPNSYIVAHSPAHARNLHRAIAYRRVLAFGDAILHAPL
jgi:hypothetical protein